MRTQTSKDSIFDAEKEVPSASQHPHFFLKCWFVCVSCHSIFSIRGVSAAAEYRPSTPSKTSSTHATKHDRENLPLSKYRTCQYTTYIDTIKSTLSEAIWIFWMLLTRSARCFNQTVRGFWSLVALEGFESLNQSRWNRSGQTRRIVVVIKCFTAHS